MIILYIIAGLIVLLLVAALFISKDMRATKEVIIKRSNREVFDFIKMLKNQDAYSKWGSLDPNMKKEYKGIDGTVGFISAWEGNKKVGAGEQEITAVKDGQALITELRFIKPFKSLAKATMTTEAIDAGNTKVTWGFESEMKYPMNILKVLMNLDKAVGDDFNTGLQNLKKLLEK